MRSGIEAKSTFVTLWIALLAAKAVVAARLPLFVDEAFYWQEGRHPAWAYSDLPGLTAWLTRLGGELFGDGVLALRLPFLLISAAFPWLVVRIARREFDARAGWIAGCAALLLPLLSIVGILGLPDVAMTLATLLCLDAMTRMLRGVDTAAAVQLACGLALGGLSHYRFVAVIGAGCIALLLIAEGRRLFRAPGFLAAVAAGALAWWPLLHWNLRNADAGLRFQLVDRHPWAFHPDGFWFLAIQAAAVTPLLFVALLAAGWTFRRHANPAVRLLAYCGTLVVAGFFLLGFVADSERVSFHWPLPGYLALLPLLPALLARWPCGLRIATWSLATAGAIALLGAHLAVSFPQVRAQLATSKWYPSNFAGWQELADAAAQLRAELPPETRVVADNFKIGAELGFLLGDARIPVLDHPLNRHHGRAPQLQLWGLHVDHPQALGDGPVLLVVGARDVEYRQLLARYRAVCGMVGALPPPRVLNVDRGRQRFLLFAIAQPATPGDAGCITPAMAWVDAPAPGARVGGRLAVSGWAFKEGAGLARIEVLLDGRVAAEADYGLPTPGLQAFWHGSTDPNHPAVGFSAGIDLADVPKGTRWLGLRLHGKDGSVEDWSEQPLVIE